MSEILESPEVIAMRKISRHPNILYMVESHYDPLPGKVTLIFELMDMSLYDLMKARKGRALTEDRVKIYLYQLLKGLEHLHKHGIFHRDIKPENILLKGDVVKLADLGSIRGIYSRPPYTEYISTRWYRSPECLLTTGFYGPKMDVWATGCVFYELLTLKPLFPGSNEVDQITKIHSILGTPHARLVAKFRRQENESPRMTNLITPSNSSHEQSNCQWRNPVLLSYITSERRRKQKVKHPISDGRSCQSAFNNFQPPISSHQSKLVQMADPVANLNICGLKVPRVVASSPNYARRTSNQSSNKSTATKISKSDKSNVVVVEETKKKLTRAWGTANICHRKRQRIVKIGERASKGSASDTSDISGPKLPSIRNSSKMIISRESSTSPVELRNAPIKRGPSTLGTHYNSRAERSFDQSYEQKHHVEQKDDYRTNSFLPMIITQKPEMLVHRGSGGASGMAQICDSNILCGNRRQKTRLATITERATPADFTTGKMTPFIKSPIAKSPAKKIPKHESKSLSPTPSSVIPSKKIRPSPKKLYEKRNKFGNIK
ncbi:glycogen synthase kinase-3-like [Neodiprion lecontei]|uniref:Glycogen synthase kinase-3-like n=1 Tax=Neodiprion lecontei TaxID=441921 RepID=A0ABM3G511_NEOLC|nr:glycogen synthase kinase-3-like [Neodiprion lecontei]